MDLDLYNSSMDRVMSFMYGPIITQIVLGGILVAAGVLILVLGHRRYRREYGKEEEVKKFFGFEKNT